MVGFDVVGTVITTSVVDPKLPVPVLVMVLNPDPTVL
jgi:hypothetical protein